MALTSLPKATARLDRDLVFARKNRRLVRDQQIADLGPGLGAEEWSQKEKKDKLMSLKCPSGILHPPFSVIKNTAR